MIHFSIEKWHQPKSWRIYILLHLNDYNTNAGKKITSSLEKRMNPHGLGGRRPLLLAEIRRGKRMCKLNS